MIKELLQEGFILKSNGYYKHAVEAFYKALELDNTSLELLLEIADVYYLMGEEERALSYLEQVLDKEPAHVQGLKLLKKIFVDKKAWCEAEQTAKNIYLITKDLDDLADVFKLLNNQQKYQEIFEYNFEGSNPEIIYQKAYAKFNLKELEEAESLINSVITTESDNKRFLLLKGKILFAANRKDECKQILGSINPDTPDSELLNFAGLIYQYNGEYKKAVKYFSEAIKLAPDRDDYYYNCASTYFKMDEIQYAKKFYTRAISLNPENQTYHFAMANLYYSEKHYKRALEELNSDFFEARLLKSIILFDSGYFSIARNELAKLAQEQPENPVVIDYRDRIEKELNI